MLDKPSLFSNKFPCLVCTLEDPILFLIIAFVLELAHIGNIAATAVESVKSILHNLNGENLQKYNFLIFFIVIHPCLAEYENIYFFVCSIKY